MGYYDTGKRYIIGGAPCRLPNVVSDHHLWVIRRTKEQLVGAARTNNRQLELFACQRHAETTYIGKAPTWPK